MANGIKLEVYTIKLRRKRDLENYYSIYESFSKGDSMQSFFEDFLKYNDKLNVDEGIRRSFQILNTPMNLRSDQGIFSGIVESGDYGVSSTIKDRKSSMIKYNKTKDDLDIKPFYFLLWFPKVGQIGYLILQRTGVYGINGIFSQTLSKFIASKFEDVLTETGRYVSKELAKKYISKGDVKEILLTRYDLPGDIIDNLVPSGSRLYSSDILSVQIKITARDKFAFLKPEDKKKENKFINNRNGKLFDTPFLNKIGMDGEHKEKLRVKLGKSERIIDMGDSFELRPYFDIEDDIETNSSSGHPIFESIDKVAIKFVEDIKNETL